VGQINEALYKVLCYDLRVLIRAMRELGIVPIAACDGIEPRMSRAQEHLRRSSG
jgi:hypothetical protein